MATTEMRARWRVLKYSDYSALTPLEGEQVVLYEVPGYSSSRRIAILGDGSSTIEELVAQIIVGVQEPTVVTTTTGTSNTNKWTKIATVTLDAALEQTNIKAYFSLHESGQSAAFFSDLSIRIAQLSAFENDPTITYLHYGQSEAIASYYTFGYVIEQNTPSTVVSIYAKSLVSSSRLFGYVIEETDTSVIEWKNNSAFESTAPSGIVTMTPKTKTISNVLEWDHGFPKIGHVYFQGNNDIDPATLYPGTTWTDVSWEEAGTTRRSAGALSGSRSSVVPARFSVSVTSGVPTVSIVSGGSGYLSGGSGTITLVIVGACTTQAVRTATVVNGVMTAISVNTSGAGYTSGAVEVYDGVTRKADKFQGHAITFNGQYSSDTSGNYISSSNIATDSGSHTYTPVTDGANGTPRTGAETSTAWTAVIKWRRTA